MKYFLLLVVLLGCNPTKQAQKLIEKHPEKVLPVFRSAFPCTTEKIDTIYNWHDTTIFVDCVPIIDTFYKQGILSRFKVKKVISIRTSTIIKEVEDSAKIRALQLELKDALFFKEEYFDKWQASKNRSSTLLALALSLLVLLLLSLFINYIQYKK